MLAIVWENLTSPWHKMYRCLRWVFCRASVMDFDPWPDRDLGLSRSYQFSIKRSGAGERGRKYGWLSIFCTAWRHDPHQSCPRCLLTVQFLLEPHHNERDHIILSLTPEVILRFHGFCTTLELPDNDLILPHLRRVI